MSDRDWYATITWTTGNGDNVSRLVEFTTRANAKRKLVDAERRLRRHGARILRTELFRREWYEGATARNGRASASPLATDTSHNLVRKEETIM